MRNVGDEATIFPGEYMFFRFSKDGNRIKQQTSSEAKGEIRHKTVLAVSKAITRCEMLGNLYGYILLVRMRRL